jgi:hypothetical protein
VSPRNGQEIEGPAVPLELSLEGARIVNRTSTDVRPYEGHIHVLLDDRLVSMTFGLAERIRGVEPGSHLIRVEFVASDHAPFEPRIFAAVTFQVTT